MATAINPEAICEIEGRAIYLRPLSFCNLASIANRVRASPTGAGRALLDAIVDEGTSGKLYADTLAAADTPRLVGEIVCLTLLAPRAHTADEIAHMLSVWSQHREAGSFR